MKRRVRISCLLLLPLLLLARAGNAQEVLLLEDAVKIALANNYDIRISSNQAAISRNNVSLANAGILPSIGGNLSTNNAVQNSTQIQPDGTQTDRSGAKNSSLNYGVNLNWTIFNGFQMFARYEQLKELKKQGDANLQSQVTATVSNVIRGYYNLVQQQQQITADDSAISLSHYRLRIAATRYEIGQAAKLDVLNARVDLNTDTTNYLSQLALYRNAKISLNEILARDVNTDFRVIDTILIDRGLAVDALLTQALQQNPSLQSVLIGRRVAELNLKQVRGQRYPAIALNTGYNFTESQSALGFATQNIGRGFNYGVTASVNIFNGFLQRRNEQNASTLISNADLEYQKLALNIRSQLSSGYQTYLTSLALVKLEESNADIARQNMEITLDKFRYGSITPLEFREAQRNYIDATVRFSNAQLQAKLAEVSLKELAGNISLQQTL